MGFFSVNGSNANNNLTYCATSSGIFLNLTNSYSAQINQTSAFSASIVMFLLAALFFVLNLFSGLSDVSTILNPKVRVFLSSALSLFLPVMSYLFSEAKNADTADATTELPLRARLILVWMLLVELLRKKVEEIRYGQGYSGSLDRFGRVIWLGSLVFSNLQGEGRKALVGILWLLCLAKLGQRIAYTEVGKRSFAFGKNASLVTSYMAKVLEKDQHRQRQDDGEGELLKACKYVVMEEENLVAEAIPSGYKLLDVGAGAGAACTTVGKIWERAETDRFLSSHDRDQKLRRLCLSMALFKLLRRRFEHQITAMTALETRSYRELIVKGMYTIRGAAADDDDDARARSKAAAEALFQVTSDELKFMSEYYHSVVPVVLASPFFLLANYFLVPLLVLLLCFVIIILCGDGDLSYAIHRIKTDNYTTFVTFFNVADMVRCLGKVLKSPLVFLCAIDISITTLLFLMFVYEELWEFFVFLFSDWFMVSLISKYCTARSPPPQCHCHDKRRTFRFAIRCLSWARNGLRSNPGMTFHQLCVLRFCWLTMPALLPVTTLPILVPTIAVPAHVKHSIMDYFTRSLHDDAVLSNGKLALADHAELLRFCDSDSVAEVILTWHIATSLLELSNPPAGSSDAAGVVATSLSKYCAYLVAFHRELLPDNPDSTKRVFEEMKGDLRRVLGWSYYDFPSPYRHLGRYRKIRDSVAVEKKPPLPETVVHKGATLGRILWEKASTDSGSGAAAVWKVVAGLWVELVVYVAPSSSDEERVAAGHANELAKGGEFVTMLWALATHAGLSRPAASTPPPPAVIPIQHYETTIPDAAADV